MQANPDERHAGSGDGPNVVLIGAAIAAVLLIGGGAWYFLSSPPPPPPAPPPEPEAVVEEAPPAPVTPDIPAFVPPAEPAVPPPSLDSSDGELRQWVMANGGEALLKPTLALSNLLQRAVTVIDNLSRGVLVLKVAALPPPEQKMTVLEQDGGLVIDPASYRRFDSLVDFLVGLDNGLLVELFHRFRPLMEQIFASLGHKAEDFDNTLILALDRVVEAKVIDGPVAVVQNTVIYRYADTALEKSSSLQKQMLRIGPDNSRRLQDKAAAIRASLLQESGH